MATTPNRAYPLFAETDSSDVATKLNAISTAVDADVANVVTKVQSWSNRVQTAGHTVGNGAYETIYGWTTVGTPVNDFYAGSGIWTVTAGLAGYYLITGQLGYPPVTSPAGVRAVRLVITPSGGSDLVVSDNEDRPDASYNTTLPFSYGGEFAVGDSFRVMSYQSQGATTALSSAPGLNGISIVRVAT